MSVKLKRSGELEGLGGWLILVGIGVVLTPLAIANLMFTVHLPVFTDGTWEAITNSGSDNYTPGLGSFIIFETVVNTALFIVSCYMIYLFFNKKPMFPRWYIGMALFSLVFVIVDAFAAAPFFPDQPVFDQETTKEVMKSLFTVLVWVPYMLVSKRVAATFK